MTIWLVRGMSHGELLPFVEVWRSRPARHQMDFGLGLCVWWENPTGSWDRAFVENLTVDDCRYRYGTSPDTIREVIRAPYRRDYRQKVV